MINDYELFSELCKKRGVIAESDITEAVKRSCSTGELRLAHFSIIANLCEIIGQVLSSSLTIKVADFSDCMLLDSGLTSLLRSLKHGSKVCKLYLRGNNISGRLVEELGELLAENTTIKILHLEWNNLGSQIDVFEKFCNALSKNNTLEELNLRYNQISTLCADFLSGCIKVNKHLKVLDLAWNSLGLTGGQKILYGIKHNNHILTLNLNGNCVPNEILDSIKDKIMKNQKIIANIEIKSKCISKDFFSRNQWSDEDEQNGRVEDKPYQRRKNKAKIKEIRKFRNSPLGDSGNENIEEIKPISDINKTSSDEESSIKTTSGSKSTKIKVLNQLVDEKTAVIENLKSEMESKNHEFKVMQDENVILKTKLQTVTDEKKDILEEKLMQIEALNKLLVKKEEEFNNSFSDLNDRYQSLLLIKQNADEKLSAYEKEFRKTNAEVSSLKEKLQNTIQNYEDSLSENKIEFHRLRREYLERENKFKIENNILKESLKDTTMELEKCQEQLQKLNTDFREAKELQLKLKIKNEEAEIYVAQTLKLEDHVQKLKHDREKLEEKLQETRKTYSQLQKQMIQLQEESLEPQKRFEAIKIELKLEKEKTKSLEDEVHNERHRIQEQNNHMQKVLTKTNELYLQIGHIQNEKASCLHEKDAEIERLQKIIDQRSRDFENYKLETVQRAQQCHAAVSKYLESFTSSSSGI